MTPLTIRRVAIDTFREHVAYLHRDCTAVRAEGFQTLSKVEVSGNGSTIQAVLNVVDDPAIVGPDELGLSEEAFARLGLPAGHGASLQHAETPASIAALHRKIAGERLSREDLHGIIRDIAQMRYSKIELAAFVVAANQFEMDRDEVLHLTEAMIAAGRRLDWRHQVRGGPVVDKHCIGGIPGNRTSMLVVPIVAAHGMLCPKTSSRAITSAAGTADAMEAVARVDLTADEVRETVRRVRGCIAWNGRLNHSALDDVMNAITRPLAIDSNRWSVASILSKKLTAGSTHVIVDLPFGPQAKLRTREEADDLGRLFERVGRALGLVVEAQATDGSAPIGRGIGPALEVRDVLQVLDNDPAAPRDLAAKAIAFASRILAWDPAIGTVEAGRARAEDLLRSGAARVRFDAIVEAQGRRTPPVRPGALTHTVHAKTAGTLRGIHIAQLSEIARRSGAPVDKAAGVDLTARIGADIRSGDALYTIHASAAAELEAAATLAEQDNGIR